MENINEFIHKVYDMDNFFYEVLEDYLYNEEDFNMEMFSLYCENIKTTYQMFFKSDFDKRQMYIDMLKPFRTLTEISCYMVASDIEHECIKFLALKAVKAIENIVHIKSKENQIAQFAREEIVWYDFDVDTPETVFERIKEYLTKEDGDFYYADEIG